MKLRSGMILLLLSAMLMQGFSACSSGKNGANTKRPQTHEPAFAVLPPEKTAEHTANGAVLMASGNKIGQPQITPSASVGSIKKDEKGFKAFSFADNDAITVDMDMDGKTGRLLLSKEDEAGNMKLLIDDGNKAEYVFEAESLVCAYVIDFKTDDGSRDIMLSYLKPTGQYETVVLSGFNGKDGANAVKTDGFVETLLSERTFKLCRKTELLGTRGISKTVSFDTSAKKFTSTDTGWKVYSYNNYVRAKKTMAVRIEEKDASLAPGTMIIPTQTDFETYIDYTGFDGRSGTIIIENNDDMISVLDGTPLEECFDGQKFW